MSQLQLFETSKDKHLETMLDFYDSLSDRVTERYRKAIHKAHPLLGLSTAFAHAHNWGNPEAKRLLNRYHSIRNRLYYRRKQAIRECR